MLAGLVLGISFLIIYSVGLHFISTSMAQDTAANMPSQSAANIMMAEAMNFFLMAGYYAVTFLSIAMAALLGADTLAGEINSGTIQTIATKPIRRADVVLGKWLGFAILLGLYVLLMAGGATLSMFFQSGHLHGVSIDHDDHINVFGGLPRSRHRRNCVWSVRSLIHWRLGRADRFYATERYRCQSWNHHQLDHPQ
jgi:hypothetical protein